MAQRFIERHNALTVTGISLFFVALLGYALIEVRAMVTGPQIAVETPGTSIVASTEPSLFITGSSSNVASLSINGSATPLTTDGRFERTILLALGYNTIVLTARDALGRDVQKTVTVMYTPPKQEHTATNLTNQDELL